MKNALNVSIKNGELSVVSPFSPYLAHKAKKLAGKYDGGGEWLYHVINKERVKQLYLEIYGVFDTPQQTVHLRCTAGDDDHEGFVFADQEPLTLQYLTIAEAHGRDTGAKIGKDISIISGKAYSGGSQRNWKTKMTTGTIFEIYDVPITIANNIIKNPEWCEKVEIIKDDTETINKEDLLIEKETLLNRIKEIDRLLEQK